MSVQTMDGIRELAQQLRVDSIRCSTSAGSGHPTSSMSAADLMAVLLARHLHYDWQREVTSAARISSRISGHSHWPGRSSGFAVRAWRRRGRCFPADRRYRGTRSLPGGRSAPILCLRARCRIGKTRRRAGGRVGRWRQGAVAVAGGIQLRRQHDDGSQYAAAPRAIVAFEL
jgi:hypothetical protein